MELRGNLLETERGEHVDCFLCLAFYEYIQSPRPAICGRLKANSPSLSSLVQSITSTCTVLVMLKLD
jgi:hypothetical protein